MIHLILQQYRPIVILAALTITLVVVVDSAWADGPLGWLESNLQTDLPAEASTPSPAIPSATPPVITVIQHELVKPAPPCQDSFITHNLDHTTTVAGNEVHLFDSNGTGLAINDLDNNGDLDLVLANLAGSNTIFWNEGRLIFRKESLSQAASRAVMSVDVDGDGWLDLVFSHPLGVRPSLWRNNGATGHPGFARVDSFKVRNPYTMSWADLDGDNDLDLVTATYDAELAKAKGGPNALGGGGIIYYENQGEHFSPIYLAYTAQTLALLLADLNEDGHLDILAGNDFYLPDQVWLWHAKGWQEAQLFTATTRNTMSFDAGDIDNDGHVEIFATDMKPYASDPETLAAWAPLLETMHEEEKLEGDPQVMENTLQVRDDHGRFENRAAASGLAATGWSWSAKFGDLDNDGFLDVYVANGMIAAEMFGHLPDHELVEENQAFRNNGKGQFIPTPHWNLNKTSSGRSMSMADLDNDGDLDIVVNNLLAPAQIFENQLCGGFGLEVELSWPASKNTRAIGASLTLHTSTGSYQRDVRAASGYLSSDPARVHFGFPSNSDLIRLDIRWPDGRISSIDNLFSQTLFMITRQ